MALDRRTILRGFLGGAAVTIGLPFLEASVGRGRARAAEGFPKRFGLFFWGNGMQPDRWTPSAQGPGWTPSEQLAPLAGLTDRISVVTGMNVTVPNDAPHGAGPAGMLSGARLVVRPSGDTHAGPTLDQVIAREVGGTTRFSSLESAAQPNPKAMSYNGPDNTNPPEWVPARLFERVFGGGFTAPGEARVVDPKLRLRRSVLDAVLSDGQRLRGRLGSQDRARLDQHFEGIRALEHRIAALEADPPNLAACMRPTSPPADFPLDEAGRYPLSAVSRAMCDLLVMAWACDQTRVFSHVFTDPVNNMLFPGATAGHHQLTHDEPGNQPEVAAIMVQVVEEYAYFVRALAAVPEGDETLLDHCVLLGTSDVALARTHSLEDYPCLLAGGCGGALRTGVHYRSPAGESASKVVLSVLRAMDLRLGTWGVDTAQVADGLSAIEV